MLESLFLAVVPLLPVQEDAPPPVGEWDAWLESPGGRLDFGLEIRSGNDGLEAFVRNGEERIRVPKATWGELEVVNTGKSPTVLVLDFEHYDSQIIAGIERGLLSGVWKKRMTNTRHAYLPFKAERRGEKKPVTRPEDAPSIDGRWSVDFARSEDPAVAIFETAADGGLRGTFLTTTGDYRFLSGTYDGDVLELSCFDGAHAFLFKARLIHDGKLDGDFWSRDRYHEKWTATLDPGAKLPDAFEQTAWTGKLALKDIAFPDLEGKTRTLADPEFAGKARIIQVFGSWCPNCHDEARYLVELQKRYGPRGLKILGLAFELTSDHERNAEQVRRYMKRHGADWPVLIAGPSNKKKASKAFPALDRIRSYPTTIFLDAEGEVRAVHTGFAGPATGEAHAKLRAEFERILEDLLREE